MNSLHYFLCAKFTLEVTERSVYRRLKINNVSFPRVLLETIGGFKLFHESTLRNFLHATQSFESIRSSSVTQIYNALSNLYVSVAKIFFRDTSKITHKLHKITPSKKEKRNVTKFFYKIRILSNDNVHELDTR